MAARRQTHLGSTKTNSLTIVDLLPPSSLPGHGSSDIILSRPATKNFIFQLSDELLLLIVELAVDGPGFRSQTYTSTTCNNGILLVLSRVCSRLRRVSQQVLYRNICVRGSMVPPSKPIIKLHRTLKERADLRQHCRSLHMHIPDVGTPPKGVDDYLIAFDFAEWLTNTRHLSIHGGFEYRRMFDNDSRLTDVTSNDRTWNLISRVVANFQDLEQVDISREGWGLYLTHIFKWLPCPRLKALDLHGISEWKHGSVDLEPEKLRTASFTSLCISDCEEGPAAISLLLQWPATLTHLTFDSFYNNTHFVDYPMFEDWLLIHQHSLKHIDIGYLHSFSRLFNATLFPNLEYLRLSRWQMHSPIRFSAEDSNILGSNVKTFAWDFTINDQHSEGWCDFGEAEAKWIQDLAECAASRKAALKRIEIQFSPDYWDTVEEMGFPWDRMNRVRDETLKTRGIELVHNQPSIERDSWLKFVRSKNIDGEGDGDEEIEDNGADDEQESAADEHDVADLLEPEFRGAYQGEDIREYLVSKANNP